MTPGPRWLATMTRWACEMCVLLWGFCGEHWRFPVRRVVYVVPRNLVKSSNVDYCNMFLNRRHEKTLKSKARISRWWFHTFFIFTPIWGRFPIWLIFFKGVETTNQICAVVGMTIKVFFGVAAPFTSWSELRSLAHLRSPTGKQGSSCVWSYNLQFSMWPPGCLRMPNWCMGMPGRVHPSSRAVTNVLEVIRDEVTGAPKSHQDHEPATN